MHARLAVTPTEAPRYNLKFQTKGEPYAAKKDRGFQNYLHKEGKSGLDPIDTNLTAASIEGWFLRQLFTFQLRTRSIISLITMLVFGIAATDLMGGALYVGISTPSIRSPGLLEYVGVAILISLFGSVFCIGIALILNFGINLGIIFGLIKVRSKFPPEPGAQKAKKKLPKRRKDYK